MRAPHWLWTGLAASLLWLGAAQADGPPPLGAQATIEALDRAHAAVVGVQVTATENAASIETLGRQRRGSGVAIGADGLILTIGYLLLDAATIDIVTPDQQSLPARAVAYDTATGFGLVRPLLPLPSLRPVPLGSVRDVQVGDLVMAATGGADGDVNMTELVSQRRFSGAWEYHLDQALFTSPPIENHSGAPLFNLRGELLGVGNLLLLDVMGNGQRQLGNLFVPVDLLKPILAELQQSGSSRASQRPWLGLTLNDQEGRVEVIRVSQDSPAETAGLKAGDLLLAVDGITVTSLETFYKRLWDRPTPDAEIQLTVVQRAEVKTLQLHGTERTTRFSRPAGI